MSVIRDHILADGSIGLAGRAAAAAVFELAEQGYLTVRLSFSKVSGVRLTRTQKPTNELLPEQKVLLKALFERGGKVRERVYITSPAQIPVAQTIMAQTRAILVREGFIKALQPRTVYRRLKIAFWAISTTIIAATAVVFHRFEAVFLATLGLLLMWAFSPLLVSNLRYRRVFRLPKAEERFKLLDSLRNHCRYLTIAPSIKITASHLPHELLWHRYGMRSVKKGLHASPPAWFDGDKWPANPDALNVALEQSVTVLTQALSQVPSGKKLIYTPDTEVQADLGEVVDKLAEGTLDILEAADVVSEISNDLGDWGGDSSGGDGGDGSGDGGGGDGGDGGGGDG